MTYFLIKFNQYPKRKQIAIVATLLFTIFLLGYLAGIYCIIKFANIKNLM